MKYEGFFKFFFCPDKRLMLKMSAVETLYSDKFKLSKTKLTSPPHTKNNIWQIRHL